MEATNQQCLDLLKQVCEAQKVDYQSHLSLQTALARFQLLIMRDEAKHKYLDVKKDNIDEPKGTD